MERLSDVVDTTVEGGDSELDLLPLPPVAGEVSLRMLNFGFAMAHH